MRPRTLAVLAAAALAVAAPVALAGQQPTTIGTGANLENTYLIFVSYSGKTVCPNGIFATASNCLVQPS